MLLRADADTQGYLVDVVGGCIVRRTRDADGKMSETVRTTAEGTRITADARGDGTPGLSVLDPAPEAIPAGRLGVYCNLANP